MRAFNLVASSRYIVIVTMIINNGQAGDDQIDINLTRLPLMDIRGCRHSGFGRSGFGVRGLDVRGLDVRGSV